FCSSRVPRPPIPTLFPYTTLFRSRWTFKELNVERWMLFVRLSAGKNEVDALLGFLDGLDDFVEIRPLAGLELGMEQFAISANFEDRKSTRLNSSHDQISYAVFCLK